MRISDLLELQVKHSLDDHQHIKRQFWIKEQKRGKRQEVVVNASIREAAGTYKLIDQRPEETIQVVLDYREPGG